MVKRSESSWSDSNVSPICGANDHDCPSVCYSIQQGKHCGHHTGIDLVAAAAAMAACWHKAIQLVQKYDRRCLPGSLLAEQTCQAAALEANTSISSVTVLQLHKSKDAR